MWKVAQNLFESRNEKKAGNGTLCSQVVVYVATTVLSLYGTFQFYWWWIPQVPIRALFQARAGTQFRKF